MGKTIVAEDKIQSQIESFLTLDEWNVGVIVGQYAQPKDLAILLTRTLKQDENGEKSDAASKRKKPKSTLTDVDEQWVISNAKQVLRLLPGGMDIIGVFAVATSDILVKAQHKLRQILFAVDKAVRRADIISDSENNNTERYLLQICLTSKKSTCKLFDTTDPKSTGKPVEWKVQSFADRWLRVDTSTSLDVVIPVNVNQMSQQLSKQIQTGLLPYCQAVNGATITFNDRLIPNDELLHTHEPHNTSRKKKHQSDNGTPQHSCTAQIFAHLNKKDTSSKVTIANCMAKLMVRGTIASRVYVHNRATASNAIQAVRRDIIRTLISRCDLLCEDLLQNEEDQDPKIMFETPVRVFAPLPGIGVNICDYLFPDEQVKDSADRCSELLGVTINPEKIETGAEKVPDDADVEKDVEHEDDDHMEPHFSEDADSDAANKLQGMLFSGGIALLACALSYYLYMGSDS